MAFIETVSEESASDEARRLLDDDRERLGYVPEFGRLFATKPEVYRAWRQLNGAIRDSMDLRRYELVTLAAARRLRSSYCALAHGTILAERFLPEETVRRLALDPRAAGLDEVDLAVMELAEKVVDDACSVTEADVERLRGLGLSDSDVLDVILAATARCFFSKTLDAAGAQADAAYLALDPALREALVVGRPIAAD